MDKLLLRMEMLLSKEVMELFSFSVTVMVRPSKIETGKLKFLISSILGMLKPTWRGSRCKSLLTRPGWSISLRNASGRLRP